MKGFLSFMGQFVEVISFVFLAGLAGYIGWLSWDSQSAYLMIMAIAVIGILGLLFVLDTTTRILGHMRKIEKTVALQDPFIERATKAVQEEVVDPWEEETPLMTPTPIAKPLIHIPDINEAIERLNARKEADARKEAGAKEVIKVVEEKPTEKPVKPILHAPDAIPVGTKKKVSHKRKKAKTRTARPAMPKKDFDEIEELSNKLTKDEKSNSNGNGNGNGTHNKEADELRAKVCPKCGVKGQMIKFGMHFGRQKWHCRGCLKTTIEPQKKIGVGAG